MTSPKTPTKYVGPNVYLANIVTRNRIPTGADYRQPETGKNYVIFSGWQVGKDPVSGTEGDLYLLSKIVANVAFWMKVVSGVTPSGGVLSLSDTANTQVFPATLGLVGNIQLVGGTGITVTSTPGSNLLTFALSGGGTGAIEQVQVQAFFAPGVNPVGQSAGIITISGASVAAHGVPVQTVSRALNAFNIETQLASEQAASSVANAGLASFNNVQFDVDASGFVTLIGSTGPATTKFQVQAIDSTGVNPVVPTNTGLVTVSAASVAAHSIPIQTISHAPNAFNIEAQLSSAQAASLQANAGLASFLDAQFDVDSLGFVNLKGSTGPAATKFTVQALTGPGVNPVLPSATGNVTISGAVVAAHSVPLETHTRAPNAYNIEVQIASLVAPTPANANSCGVACFNSNDFTIDATSGMVSAVSGVFVWTDVSGGVTAVSNNGYFVTGTTTSTLPAAPAQGDIVRYFVDTANILTIQATGTQVIRVGNTVSAAAGTTVSSQRGDSISLVYRASDTQWCCVDSPTGAWTTT